MINRNVKKIEIPIPYGRQTIDRADIKAVTKVLESNYLTQGSAVCEFEDAMANYCGAKYAVAFSSGTAALHGACFAANISQGDEVITTPLTFAASANCILYCGGTPVFVDIQKNIPLIDTTEIKKKVTSKTKAIIPVDYSGVPADYFEINKIARKYRLTVIADAAHSLGASYKGKKVGKLVDMTVFSFHPVKAITTGEGGMVVTDNKSFYERLKLFHTHGITKDTQQFKRRKVGPWYYEMQELGYNYRLTDIGAALGLSQLTKIDSFIKRRQEISDLYKEAFAKFQLLQVLPEFIDRTSAWHLFPIQLVTARQLQAKRQLVEKLHEYRVIVQVHYIPIHLYLFYKKIFGYKRGDFRNSENYYDRQLSLPIFPRLTNKQLRYVVSTVKNVLGSFV